MITIKKEVSITIDGEDYEILLRLCEFARTQLRGVKDGTFPMGCTDREVFEVRRLLTCISDEVVYSK